MKCPKCNKEIDSLRNIQSGTMEYCLNVVKGEAQYKTYESEFESDGKTNEYLCPECDAVLFTSELEATDFLAGFHTDRAYYQLL